MMERSKRGNQLIERLQDRYVARIIDRMGTIDVFMDILDAENDLNNRDRYEMLRMLRNDADDCNRMLVDLTDDDEQNLRVRFNPLRERVYSTYAKISMKDLVGPA